MLYCATLRLLNINTGSIFLLYRLCTHLQISTYTISLMSTGGNIYTAYTVATSTAESAMEHYHSTCGR